MKKFLFPALALGLVMTSCQSDEPFAPGMGEEVQATFTISVPDAMGTRAGEVNSAKGGFSNGAGNLNYTVALLRAEDDVVMWSSKTPASVNGKSATFNPTVVQGYTYNIVAYATFDAAIEAPAVGSRIPADSGLGAIATLEGINNESEDAYFCNTSILGASSMEATLKRPFGKLRLVAEDYDKFHALGLEVANVKVTYGGAVVMNTQFDASTKAFEGTATSKVFEFTGETSYSEEADKNTNGVYTVFVDYLPASETGETMYPFEIEVTYKDGKGTYTRSFSQDIPVKRNYLTTLRGDFFTTEAALTLKVEEMFANEETINLVSVSNASQLQEAINNATPGETTEIILGNDIELTGSLVFGDNSGSPAPTRSGAAKSFVLDLNGKTINAPLEREGRHYYAILNNANLVLEGEGAINARGIKNFGEMTINGNVTITNIDTDGGAAVWNEGRLTINNGTFISSENAGNGSYGAALNTRAGGEAVVNGGRFEAYSQLTYAIVNEGNTTINNATVKGKHGAVAGSSSAITAINDGSFELMENPGVSDHCAYYVSDIRGGVFSINEADTTAGDSVFYESTIAAGYKAIENGDKYYVVPNEIDAVATTTEELAEVLANSNISTIMLGKGTFEIELYTKYPARESMTIIGTEGTKVKFANQQVRMALFKNFTIKNCEILHMSTKKWGMLVFGGGNKADGVYTVENCLFNGVGTQGIYINEDTAGATYNVKNCTFKGDFGSEGAVVIQNNANLNGEGVVNVTVKDNTFNNVTAYKITLLNKENGKLNLDTDVADSEIGKFNR